jgi:predicted dehydrogenase
MEEARELCALAERLDRRLMVGHILQYHPAFMRLQELVREGRLGRLHSLSARRMNLGRIRREEDVMWDLAPHDISMVLALTGAEPDRVTAIGGCHLRSDIADTVSLHLGFAGGEQAGVTVSWLHPVKEHRLVVIGSEAMAVFDDGEPWERKLVLFPHRVEWRDGAPIPVRGEPVPVEVAPAEPLREECRHFLDCVRTGARPRTDGREGLRVMSVLDRASRFMDEARPAALRDIA